MIDMDYNISEATQIFAKTIYEWPKKLSNTLDQAGKRHYEEREAIETKMYKRRDQFEKDMVAFMNEISGDIVAEYDDLFSYPTFIGPIKEFNARFLVMKERKDRLENEENILLGFKSAYESYFQFEKFFEPHYLLWTTIEKFLDSKKKWKSFAASSLDIEEITKLKTETLNVVRKLKNNKTAFANNAKQREVIEGLARQVKDLESWFPIIEALNINSLKERHWDEIKKISGPDIDFKKLSVDRIKFLKLEYLLEPIFEISSIAAQENSLEQYLIQMDKDLSEKQLSSTDPKNISELKSLIHEQLSNIKTLKTNKYIGPILDKVEHNESKLLSLLDSLENSS